MTFLLVCALCTSSPTPTFDSHLEPPRVASTIPASLGSLPVVPVGPSLRLDHGDPAASHDGHGGESHMGPMWVVMGVMMVAMMATAGIVMMRGGSNGRVQAFDAAPASGGASSGLTLRFGASGPGR